MLGFVPFLESQPKKVGLALSCFSTNVVSGGIYGIEIFCCLPFGLKA